MDTNEVTPLVDYGPQITPMTLGTDRIDPNVSDTSDTQQQPVQQPPTAQQPQLSNRATGQQPNTAQAQPALTENQKRSGIFHNIMEVLAGPQTKQYRINPQTGAQEEVAQPRRSGTQLANSIVAGALTGLFAGAGKHDPLEAAAAGFNARQQQDKEADAQARAKASDDFGRHQGVLDANMRAMNNALQYSKMDKDAHDSMVGSFASQLQDIKDTAPEMIKSEGVSEAEAADVQKHSGLDWLRIPDGVVPRLDENGKPVYMDFQGNFVPEGTPGAHQVWDNTYSLIDKNARVNISNQDGPLPWIKEAVNKWGGTVPGASPSVLVGNGGKGTLSAYTAGKMMYQVTALDGLQKELDTYVDRLNEGRTKDRVQSIDLKSAIQNKTLSLNDVLAFQRVAGMSTQPDLQIDALRQKNPDAAGRITALFNQGGDNLEDFKRDRLARQQAAKKAITSVVNENEALAVKSNPSAYSPDLVASANAFLKNKQSQTGGEAAARTTAEQKAKTDALLGQKENGISIVDAIGTGHITPDRMGYLLSKNPDLVSAVVAKYPDFDSSKAQSYPQVYKDFTSGKTSVALNSGSTALKHLAELKTLNTYESRVPGTSDYKAYHNKLDTVAGELVKFYGMPDTDKSITAMKDTLGGLTNRDAAIVEQAESMGDKFDSYEQQWLNAAPSSQYQARMPGVDNEAKKARAALDPRYAARQPNRAFSISAWQKANPNGDVNAAKTSAQQQGYQVVQ